ncbi:MAG: 3-deoxy-D-manno-octulosonic acid transferase [Xanthomonadales bacterium]|nr:3-deoxy-D-manno-octulosonic acid transferase [Xanthomonadales bacterium]NIX14176.1 3-deoxy-D-manno-octulosonic acid transferase [Xanthomonadales bacterium]
MRKLYSLAMYLGLPLILAHLALRGLRDRDYLKRWGERFGRFKPPETTGGIVVHAASVGEVNAAAPLISALGERFPGLAMTITTFTPTGSARAKTLAGERSAHVYAPLDIPGAVRRFFGRLEPRLLVVMETEIWPNLYAEAARRDIPILLANARMSERSETGYRRWGKLVADALSRVSHVAAQGPADAERFVSRGQDPARIEVAGNLKFDITLPDELAAQGMALRGAWGPERPVLLAGSTHRSDEQAVLAAFRQVLEKHPNALLILVPRHPERFGEAAQLAREAGLAVEMFSDREVCSPAAQCFVIDAMGELLRFYACCDVAVVGGTFADIGGHNPLEPAALGKPVIVGPHTYHFGEITGHLLDAGALLQLEEGAVVGDEVIRLFGDYSARQAMGRAALAAVEDGRGAVARNLAAAVRLLGPEK